MSYHGYWEAASKAKGYCRSAKQKIDCHLSDAPISNLKLLGHPINASTLNLFAILSVPGSTT